MTVYLVHGTRQNASPNHDGEWENHWSSEVVRVFSKREDAEIFINNMKSKEPSRPIYGDISYFRGGYYSMQISEREMS